MKMFVFYLYSQPISYLIIIMHMNNILCSADAVIHMSKHDNLVRIINNAVIVDDHEKTPVEHESNERADSTPVHEESKIVHKSISRERDDLTPIHEILVEYQPGSAPFDSKYS